MDKKNKIDWQRKLTSRKFWAAVVGFATTMMVAVGSTEAQVTQTAAVIMAGATLIAYIIGEGLTDAAAVDQPEEGIAIEERLEIEEDDSE